MSNLFDVIAFDADDTLWDNEHLYLRAEQHLQRLLEPYCPAEQTAAMLHRIDIANLPDFGYGIKAYTLSMVETALEVSRGRIARRGAAPGGRPGAARCCTRRWSCWTMHRSACRCWRRGTR